MTETTNLGWLYYKKYYSDFTESHFEDINNQILDFKYQDECAANNDLGNPNHKVILKTTYPGLLIGSGYQHESHGMGEFKIGFFFDYSTGLPQIPGSSVKGVLRSLFPNEKDSSEVKEGKCIYINDTLSNIIKIEILSIEQQILKEELKNLKEGIEDIKRRENHGDKLTSLRKLITEFSSLDLFHLEKLEDEMFVGKIVESDNYKDGELQTRQLSIYKRDIFYDAVIANENGIQKLVSSDFITPHSNPLKDPNPLMFLKVLPEILIKFQFSCHDSHVIDGLTAWHKIELFKQLLLDFGVGAKTNVGYGQFDEHPDNVEFRENERKDAKEIEEQLAKEKGRIAIDKFKENVPLKLSKTKNGESPLIGIVERKEGNVSFIKFKVGDINCEIKKADKLKGKKKMILNEKDEVQIRVTNDYDPNGKATFECSITLLKKL